MSKPESKTSTDDHLSTATSEEKNGVKSEPQQQQQRVATKRKRFSLVASVMIVLAVFVALGASLVWNSLLEFEEKFFLGRAEYLLMNNMTRWTKLFLLKLPILSHDARTSLEINTRGHKTHMEYYDKSKHDNSHRKLINGVLTKPECASLRSLLLRTSLRRGVDVNATNMDSSIDLEFSSLSVFRFLGIHDDPNVHSTEEEKAILRRLLKRVQEEAEEAFDAPNMVLEYSDITLRRNPIPNEGLSNFIKRLHYLSTGGHGLHSDQCQTDISSKTSFEVGFSCNILEEHYYAYRTHSVLLYLNDEDDTDLKGGELYLVDRQDLLDPDKPSYSGLGLAQQLQHTLRVKPSCGTLVLFASDARNLHGTMPIIEGSRFAMPMWFSNPPDLPQHERYVLHKQMSVWFWSDLRYYCHYMGTGDLPVPTGLRQYLNDCDGMVEAFKEMVLWDEDWEDADWRDEA